MFVIGASAKMAPMTSRFDRFRPVRNHDPVSMKLRHAAALAIFNFYLIAPPLQKDDPSRIDLMAPFGQWVIEERYDTEEACFEGRDKMMTLGSADFDNGKDSGLDRQRVNSLCINADDPRLKEK